MQRQDARGHRQQAVARPLAQSDRAGRSLAPDRGDQGAERMQQGRRPRRRDGRTLPRRRQGDQAHGDGRARHQSGRQGRLGRRQAQAGQQTRQMGAHGRRHPPGPSEQDRQADHGPVPAHAAGRRRPGAGPSIRQDRRIQRQAQQQMRPRPDETGAAPTQGLDHQQRQRPAQRAAEGAQQGDSGDRLLRRFAVQGHQDGVGRTVQPHPHARAQHQHARDHRRRLARQPQQRQGQGEDHGRRRQHLAPAAPVDPASAERAERRRDQEGPR
ncbi:hypothetical protein D3C73_894790 [compost metagenome]